MKKNATEITIINEGGFFEANYSSTLTITTYDISYKKIIEENEYFPISEENKPCNFSYDLDSCEEIFDKLVEQIEQVYNELNEGIRPIMFCTDVGLKEIYVSYDNNTKIGLSFFIPSLYGNGFDEIPNLIRSLLVSCDKLPEYLLSDDELHDFDEE